MAISLNHSFLFVHDQDEALAFYTDLLGLELRSDADMGHMRWLTVGAPGQDDVQLGLLAVGPPSPPADWDTLRELVAKGSMPALIFRVDSCAETFERLRAGGAEVLQEPVRQSYGVVDCAFRDPSGNMVRFSEYLDG
ncbi:VOC family protein [Conexibacter arvalis]|uniref:Catechol 2,3-dioxygenase-like lactoylglutathione lyase family enzyme n=1 Tax=Conexibacter arvalis TaxID=912552 RepID=A0A840IDN1_9ACTN|nr:VOC family protein [Conexibacter arvalis]MBB4662361.1 catechol 2,3-dioxygenase-like lactoylglutathione lyase family enzyme [Conexibacter arvalis]